MFLINFHDKEYKVKLFEMSDFLAGVYFSFVTYCNMIDDSENFTAYSEILEDMLSYFADLSKDFSKEITFDYFNSGDWKYCISEKTREAIGTFTIRLIDN